MTAEQLPLQPEAWQDQGLLEAVARPYYHNLPYHNWRHVSTVCKGALKNAALCADNGLLVDTDVIVAASLFHDADYWLQPGVDHNFASKEQYSAWLAGNELAVLGMPEDKIRHVQDIILSTEKGAPCLSLEARCVRQADLANIASRNPFFFLRNTFKLYLESKHLVGNSLVAIGPDEFIRFCRVSYDILVTYLDEDISLGPFDMDTNNKSPFHNRAVRNTALLLSPDHVKGAWAKLTARH